MKAAFSSRSSALAMSLFKLRCCLHSKHPISVVFSFQSISLPGEMFFMLGLNAKSLCSPLQLQDCYQDNRRKAVTSFKCQEEHYHEVLGQLETSGTFTINLYHLALGNQWHGSPLLKKARDIIPADGVVSIWPLQNQSFWSRLYLHTCAKDLWHQQRLYMARTQECCLWHLWLQGQPQDRLVSSMCYEFATFPETSQKHSLYIVHYAL